MRLIAAAADWAEKNLGAPAALSTELSRADILIRNIAGTNFGLEGVLATGALLSSQTFGLRPGRFVFGTLLISTTALLVLDLVKLQINKKFIENDNATSAATQELKDCATAVGTSVLSGSDSLRAMLKQSWNGSKAVVGITDMNAKLIGKKQVLGINTIIIGRLALALQAWAPKR